MKGYQALIHPVLFALFFILALYSANVSEVSFGQILWPAVIVVGCVLVGILAAWLLIRDIHRAAVLTSIAVILCFSFGHVVYAMDDQSTVGFNFFTPVSGTSVLILMLWFLLFCSAVYFLRWGWKKKWGPLLSKVTVVLNVMAVIFTIMPIFTVIVHRDGAVNYDSYGSDSEDIQVSSPRDPPDIYYIILDRYAGSTTLQETLGFSNSDFTDYLKQKGFYVAQESSCNYLNTEHSLASSLSMDYLDSVAAEVGEGATDVGPLYHMLRDYRVWHLLKGMDYSFVHLGSWWEPTRENEFADLNINYGGSMPEFSRLLFKTSAVYPIGRMADLWQGFRNFAGRV